MRGCAAGAFSQQSPALKALGLWGLGQCLWGGQNPGSGEQERERGGRRRNMRGQSCTRPLCPGRPVWPAGFPSEAWLVPAPAGTTALLVPRPWVVSVVKP